jgi:hypothetical protein
MKFSASMRPCETRRPKQTSDIPEIAFLPAFAGDRINVKLWRYSNGRAKLSGGLCALLRIFAVDFIPNHIRNALGLLKTKNCPHGMDWMRERMGRVRHSNLYRRDDSHSKFVLLAHGNLSS